MGVGDGRDKDEACLDTIMRCKLYRQGKRGVFISESLGGGRWGWGARMIYDEQFRLQRLVYIRLNFFYDQGVHSFYEAFS